ncbi:MAG: hypothetical protein ACYCUD_05860 [Candidatus Dormibacteria bacterium]
MRRDGPRLAAGLAVVAVVGTVYLLRQRRRRGREDQGSGDWIEDMPEEWRLRLQELLQEAAGHVHPDPSHRRAEKSRGLAQTVALRAGRLAAPVVMNAVAKRLAGRPPDAAG